MLMLVLTPLLAIIARMSNIISSEVESAFTEASLCVDASNCKKAAEAMCKFYAMCNQQTAENGEGLLVFFDPVQGPCPNRDQLLCQERIEY